MAAVADWLSQEENDLMGDAVKAIVAGVGEKLTGVVLVGAAVKPVRHQGPLPLKLVVAVSALPVATLTNLAHQSLDVVRRGVHMRIITKREVLRSGDVFALRFADYQRRHFVLFGAAPFLQLHVTQADLRLGIERKLRQAAQAVRQTIISGMGEHGEVAMLRERMQVIIGDVVTIADHLLRMLGIDQPTEEHALIEALAAHTHTEVTLLLPAIVALRTGDALPHPVATLAELASLIGDATNAIDRFGAAIG